jgi:hypothetical protein
MHSVHEPRGPVPVTAARFRDKYAGLPEIGSVC